MTPAALRVTNPINLVFSSPAIPATVAFSPGASVRQFIGGSGSSVSLQSNAQDQSALNSVSSVQSSTTGSIDQSSKAGFDTDSVTKQINFGFAGEMGMKSSSLFDMMPPTGAGNSEQEAAPGATDGSGVDMSEEFGEDDDERKKKRPRPSR